MTHDASETTIAADELRSIVDRMERLGEERAALGEDMREVLTEAGLKGYDKKAIRQVLRIRAADRAELEAQEELVQLYMRAIS